MVGETNRLPFDLAEGEGELTGGFHTEYCSMRFAMFFLGEYVNMFTVSALATTMFLGGWQAPPGIAAINDGMFNEGWWGLLWFTAKLWMFMFFFVWLRGSLPRVRYDQFMRFGWKFLIPVTLAWVVAGRRSSAAPSTASSRRHVTSRAASSRSRPSSSSASSPCSPSSRLDVGRQRRGQRPRRSRARPSEIDPYAGATPCRRCPASACASPRSTHRP